jgi:ABC-type transport system involved in multi-copper enzyme maturation permease subunit
VSQTAVVARLALRELWITFRLLLLLALYVGTGVVAALVAAPPATTLLRLAVGVAVAAVCGATVAAWSLSRERRLGRAGWLTTRSIPRRTIVTGWFITLALVSLVGLAAAGFLGWLAESSPDGRLDPVAFAAAFVAVGCAALALAALGLLLGTLFGPISGSVTAALLGAVVIGGSWLLASSVVLPFELLARVLEPIGPVSVAAQGAGGALLATAFLLTAARVAMQRVDL